jgi:hypothetical protein
MNIETQKIIISQEFLQSAIVDVDINGKIEQSWTGLTYLLSGGTDGTSLLTGLTIPIMFCENYKDLGYYSGFDGAIYQKDINNSYIYSATTSSPYTLYVYNTSAEYAQDISYQIDWGDNSQIQSVNVKAPDYISHNYAPLSVASSAYTVSLSGTAAWGTTVTKKK